MPRTDEPTEEEKRVLELVSLGRTTKCAKHWSLGGIECTPAA